MLPTVVLVEREIDLQEGTPLRPLGLADEAHSSLLRQPVRLERIALDAGADDILPGCRAAPVARNDVVQVQVVAIKSLAAVLAGVLVSLEDVVPGEFHILLWQVIVNDQKNHPRHPDAKGNRAHRFGVRFVLGEVVPLVEVEGLKRTIVAVEHNLSVALEQECQRPTSRANINRLPEAIKHQHMLVERRTHIRSNLAQTTQTALACQRADAGRRPPSLRCDAQPIRG